MGLRNHHQRVILEKESCHLPPSSSLKISGWCLSLAATVGETGDVDGAEAFDEDRCSALVGETGEDVVPEEAELVFTWGDLGSAGAYTLCGVNAIL